MQLGKVVGTVVLNNQNDTLQGVPLLLVQPISSSRRMALSPSSESRALMTRATSTRWILAPAGPSRPLLMHLLM